MRFIGCVRVTFYRHISAGKDTAAVRHHFNLILVCLKKIRLENLQWHGRSAGHACHSPAFRKNAPVHPVYDGIPLLAFGYEFPLPVLQYVHSPLSVGSCGLTSTCNMPPWIHERSGTLRRWDSEISRGNLESPGTVVPVLLVPAIPPLQFLHFFRRSRSIFNI